MQGLRRGLEVTKERVEWEAVGGDMEKQPSGVLPSVTGSQPERAIFSWGEDSCFQYLKLWQRKNSSLGDIACPTLRSPDCHTLQLDVCKGEHYRGPSLRV